MIKLPHMPWLRTFEAAARHKSFVQAADELGFTAAAVSQQIKLLEQHLGAALFLRRAQGVVLTDFGQAYALPLRQAFAEIQKATQDIFGNATGKRLRIYVSSSYATFVLAPILMQFQQLFAQVELQITTATWTELNDDKSYDLEIRFGDGLWQDEQALFLGQEYAHMVCHPQLLAAHGGSMSFEQLSQQAVRIIGCEQDWYEMAQHYKLAQPLPPALISCDSSIIALQCLSPQRGAAIVAHSFTAAYLQRGALVSPLDCRLKLARNFYLIANKNSPEIALVQAFSAWLRAARGLSEA